MTDRIKDIPANPNSIENGVSDPTPEKGKGGTWRAIISWLKGFGTALLIVAILLIPKPVLADSGCNSEACYQSGYYIEWSWFGPYACYWWYVQYFTPPYNTIYGDCHGNYTY